jgi:SAM-dependent methyltransferase
MAVPLNERSVEYSYVFKQIAKHNPRRVIDLGVGKTALPSLVMACGIDVIAVDKDERQVRDNPCNRGGYCSVDIVEEEIMDLDFGPFFDMVICISTLEHIIRHQENVKKMAQFLSPKGVIVLTCPYAEDEYCINAYDPNMSYETVVAQPNICQMYSRNEVDLWCQENDLTVQDQEYWQIFTNKLWGSGEAVLPYTQVGKDELHNLSCLTLTKTGDK